MRRLELSAIRAVAARRGGDCLSTSYRNCAEKLEWRCAESHTWKATATNVIHFGQWCPYCSGHVKTEEVAGRLLDEIKGIAALKGGTCLSPRYAQRVELLCGQGHTWEADPSSVRKGTWCRACAGSLPHGIGAMQKLASERGGFCLSPTYTNAKTKLRWQCSKDHIWEATPTQLISAKSWCPHCAGCARSTIEELQKLAASRGGKCLSPSYRNNRQRLQWQCAKGHVWEAKATHITFSQSWCPTCNAWAAEEQCRKWFENHFHQPFPQMWPRWLLSSSARKHPMQLDGYNVELELAFEYQGKQHYDPVSYFHGTSKRYADQIRRDQEKAALCGKHGVTLIIIPYTERKRIGEFLQERVLKLNLGERLVG